MALEDLDEAYERLLGTGPEFDGWLSNHGPMAAEALARHGHGDAITGWLDGYVRNLEPAPTSAARIQDWRQALGDARRLGDWLAWFEEEMRERPWTEVLALWWPRLLPGIAAGATHGVIRVGHAVRVLREDGETAPRVAELAQGLGYWAARWQPVPRPMAPSGRLAAGLALDGVGPVPNQSGGITDRIAQLQDVDGWLDAQAALDPTGGAEVVLRDIVTASVDRYTTRAHGNPVMLVHAITAPNAVLRTLPSLPAELRNPSVAAAWTACAAVHAAYAPAEPARFAVGTPASAEDAFELAGAHGDEHVIKLADSVLDVHRWTGDVQVLRAIEVAALLVPRPT